MFGLPETALAKFELCASFSDAFFRRRANFTATSSLLEIQLSAIHSVFIQIPLTKSIRFCILFELRKGNSTEQFTRPQAITLPAFASPS
jgi:hypothetical protein